MSQFEQVTEIAVEQQFDPRKNYTVYVNPENRHITGFVGFIVPVESLNDGAGWPSYNLQNLTKEEYSMLSMGINNKDIMAFLETRKASGFFWGRNKKFRNLRFLSFYPRMKVGQMFLI